MNTWQDEPVCDIIDASMDLPEFETTRTAYPYPFVPKRRRRPFRTLRDDSQNAGDGSRDETEAHRLQNGGHWAFGRSRFHVGVVVTANAFDMLGLPRTGIRTVSMPCFGMTAARRATRSALRKSSGAF